MYPYEPPRVYTRGLFLEFKFRLTRLLFALITDAATNDGFVDPHRGGEKPSSPYPATIPIGFSTGGNFSFNLRLVILFNVATTAEAAYLVRMIIWASLKTTDKSVGFWHKAGPRRTAHGHPKPTQLFRPHEPLRRSDSEG